ncbi:CpaD family pilus assembly protein [Brucella intermedia]|uniref:CpaD family pilus assembly protein n=1 Tax=Brucella intermedia TaxID=94625 RepID=UPI00124F5A31|nr:CpaD family pilus assembly protein [Brucella intermedia]KAB2732162.1 pilus assembly protein CpaD [Brucella intermedia]
MTYSVRGFCRISARPALVALSLALLAGCANRQHVTVGALPDDYRTNHPITIAEREQVTDIPIAQADRKLSPMQRGIVQGAIANYRRSGSGMLYVLVPSGASNQAAAYRLSTEVAATLRNSGIKANNIAIENYPVESPDAAAPIRISYYAITAGTTPCGRWPDDLASTPENKHYANFGCASQNNLAAQVANPADLLGPRTMTPIDSDRATARLNSNQGYVKMSPAQTQNWREPRSQQAEY